jgi:hypothetical protein
MTIGGFGIGLVRTGSGLWVDSQGLVPTSEGLSLLATLPIDPDYQAILDYATANGIPLPSAPEQIMNNATMYDLKASGVWDKSDALWVTINVGNSAFATLNWKNPASFRLVIVNSVTWDNVNGFEGDGVSGHVTTGFNAAIHGVNYTLNNAGIMFNVTTAASLVTTPLIGLTTTRGRVSNSAIDPQRINSDTSFTASAVMAGTGMRSINRISSTQVTFVNDATSSTLTLASTAVTSDSFMLFRSGVVYGNSSIGFVAIGGSYV